MLKLQCDDKIPLLSCRMYLVINVQFEVCCSMTIIELVRLDARSATAASKMVARIDFHAMCLLNPDWTHLVHITSCRTGSGS